jgi:pantoate--beta-alanine ligase
MQVIESVSALVAARTGLSGATTMGFVPTMGYLHSGHLSLVRRAREENASVLASIFVNPLQFGPREDLARYPRNLPRDLSLLEAAGVDLVFAPPAEEMYPAGFATHVEPGGALAERLEAAVRPGHFRGVSTVVLKLFHLTRPTAAYFGQKDAQQVAVLRRMVADLNLPLNLRILPIVRESDGLAMSSRNSYLGPEDRAAATILYRALQAGSMAFDAHPVDGVAAVKRVMEETILAEPRATCDYADICDPDSFEPLSASRAPALLALAVRLGPVRLIDNFLLRPDGIWDKGTEAERREKQGA